MPHCIRRLEYCKGNADTDSAAGTITGERTSIEDFPYIVSFYNGSKDPKQSPCIGSIVSRNLVLTTAYCAAKFETNTKVIRSGSNDRKTGGRMHTIAMKYLHEDYNSTTLNHNIALIRVVEKFDDPDKPIVVNYNPEQSNVGNKGVVAGWGKINSENWMDGLYESNVNIISDEIFRTSAPHAVLDHFFYVKDSDPKNSTCYGDGAPFVVEEKNMSYIAGFLTQRTRDCERTSIGIFIDLSRYYNWIVGHF
ncbi:hypothetical protein QAD02_006395 [Eretmocerus hayati]|uniref:Uncharacterized protein n=1 Tax=Eretmocerus hayati TaxID=131215 RepID=A0ACC2N0U0_9HYME|nr:hypothetical protein QAD02_006395 [Eretmocerus hayati]